ncbi:uncharacterized protein BO80DRAFT_504415 [Aspergillus ibericus CBS 121593]|uniref:C2H2-type domain-containing protein n=1 Tax=Aspergillus ibericus CBS 121593 TaxID=1448316 RepID=A0A395GRG3_9EURO|nr:hypothetical protein BO80DRAFT_504415 [Aspergillus ibericus CBS 121593]RAK97962.1 hypothetical protein BO80DRAFT_504415 [Aspergillus ibericus CBS 121593]
MAGLSEQNNQLRLAITKTSKTTLENVLQALCNENLAVREYVTGKLLIAEDRVAVPPLEQLYSDAPDSDGSDSDESDSHGSNSDGPEKSEDQGNRKRKAESEPDTTGSKKLRTRYAMCLKCDKEFDVTTNSRRSCRFHPDKPHTVYHYERMMLIQVQSTASRMKRNFQTMTRNATVHLIRNGYVQNGQNVLYFHTATEISRRRAVLWVGMKRFLFATV